VAYEPSQTRRILEDIIRHLESAADD